MAEIFEEQQFVVLVQSIDEREAGHVIEAFKALERPRSFPFRLERNADLSLFLILIRVKWFLQSRLQSNERAILFVDEGWKKSGTALCIEPWSTFLEHGCVFFARSDAVWGLQLADFAGFVLNRSQQTLAKTSLSELDAAFLPIIDSMSRRFVNIPTLELGLERPEGAAFQFRPLGPLS